MNMWMKGALSLLGLILTVVIVALAIQRLVGSSAEVFSYPFPDEHINGTVRISCSSGGGSFSPEQNALRAYADFSSGRDEIERAPVPRIDLDNLSASEAVDQIDRTIQGRSSVIENLISQIEDRYGCEIRVIY